MFILFAADYTESLRRWINFEFEFELTQVRVASMVSGAHVKNDPARQIQIVLTSHEVNLFPSFEVNCIPFHNQLYQQHHCLHFHNEHGVC